MRETEARRPILATGIAHRTTGRAYYPKHDDNEATALKMYSKMGGSMDICHVN